MGRGVRQRIGGPERGLLIFEIVKIFCVKVLFEATSIKYSYIPTIVNILVHYARVYP